PKRDKATKPCTFKLLPNLTPFGAMGIIPHARQHRGSKCIFGQTANGTRDQQTVGHTGWAHQAAENRRVGVLAGIGGFRVPALQLPPSGKGQLTTPSLPIASSKCCSFR